MLVKINDDVRKDIICVVVGFPFFHKTNKQTQELKSPVKQAKVNLMVAIKIEESFPLLYIVTFIICDIIHEKK